MSGLPLDQLVQGHHWNPLTILDAHPMAQGSSPTEPFDVSVDNKLPCPVFAAQDLSGSTHLPGQHYSAPMGSSHCSLSHNL